MLAWHGDGEEEGGAYLAIQFLIEVEPLKEMTISLSTGSTATKPRMSNTVPLVGLVRYARGVQVPGNSHERGNNSGLVRGGRGALVQVASDGLAGRLLAVTIGCGRPLGVQLEAVQLLGCDGILVAAVRSKAVPREQGVRGSRAYLVFPGLERRGRKTPRKGKQGEWPSWRSLDEFRGHETMESSDGRRTCMRCRDSRWLHGDLGGLYNEWHRRRVA